MSVNASQLGAKMIRAARESFGPDWKAARKYAQVELKHLARILLEISKLCADGELTKAEARSLLRLHRNATEIVLLTAKGIGVLAVEKAINAALGAVKDMVNAAAKAPLL